MLEEVLAIFILILNSIGLRFLLQYLRQKWICTFAHTATITTLPVITYIITSVISRDIALSLGMVGALSIVRFRNPVRSPFELSVYFAVITMGIAAAVDLKWLTFYILSIVMVFLILTLVSKIYNNFFATKFFISSFSEGDLYSSLEINSHKPIKLLDESPLLKSKSKSKDHISYVLISANFTKLKDLLSLVEKDNSISIDYQLSE